MPSSEGLAGDFEALLRQAFQPIEPPASLEARLEEDLAGLVEAAAEELEAWEISGLKDPRNWVKPAVTVGVGGVAAVGLVLVRTQRKRHKRRADASDPLDLAQRTLRDLAHEAGKLIDEAQKRL
jgi:hypothetical protein